MALQHRKEKETSENIELSMFFVVFLIGSS